MMYTRREKAIADIIEYFENNEDIFNEAIEDLDGYNGWLVNSNNFCL